jgi:hypothetical protein
MKNLIFLGIIAVLVFGLSFCTKDKYDKEKTTVLETDITNEEVINVANATLTGFKSSTLSGNVSDFGFNSSAELDQIHIGTPFLQLALKTDFRKDSLYDCMDKYLSNNKNGRFQ